MALPSSTSRSPARWVRPVRCLHSAPGSPVAGASSRCGPRPSTAAVQARSARRAGVEGTLAQGRRVFALRQARYRGLAKTHLQDVLNAIAVDFVVCSPGSSRVATRKRPVRASSPSPQSAEGCIRGERRVTTVGRDVCHDVWDSCAAPSAAVERSAAAASRPVSPHSESTAAEVRGEATDLAPPTAGECDQRKSTCGGTTLARYNCVSPAQGEAR